MRKPAAREVSGLRLTCYLAAGAVALLVGSTVLCDLDRSTETTVRVVPPDPESRISLEVLPAQPGLTHSRPGHEPWPLISVTNLSDRPVAAVTVRLIVYSHRGERIGHFTDTPIAHRERQWGLEPGATEERPFPWKGPHPSGRQVFLVLEEWWTWSDQPRRSRRDGMERLGWAPPDEVVWSDPDLQATFERADAMAREAACTQLFER
jgi:hypothetical protein